MFTFSPSFLTSLKSTRKTNKYLFSPPLQNGADFHHSCHVTEHKMLRKKHYVWYKPLYITNIPKEGMFHNFKRQKKTTYFPDDLSPLQLKMPIHNKTFLFLFEFH